MRNWGRDLDLSWLRDYSIHHRPFPISFFGQFFGNIYVTRSVASVCRL